MNNFKKFRYLPYQNTRLKNTGIQVFHKIIFASTLVTTKKAIMKYSKILVLLFMGVFFTINAQNVSDQLFLNSGETIAVKIKKIEPNTITYVYLGEELENVVKKENVNK